MRMMQGMLSHTLLKEASYLEGMHATAFNRICNQVWPERAGRSMFLITSACLSNLSGLSHQLDQEQTPPVRL